MTHFVYNDTFARLHDPPIPLPVPREFTFVYVDGWGARSFPVCKPQLDLVRRGDVLIANFGAHYSRVMTFEVCSRAMNHHHYMRLSLAR